jgi:hypothetical protein
MHILRVSGLQCGVVVGPSTSTVRPTARAHACATHDSRLTTHDSRLTTHDLLLTTYFLRLTPNGLLPLQERALLIDHNLFDNMSRRVAESTSCLAHTRHLMGDHDAAIDKHFLALGIYKQLAQVS